MTSHLSNSVQLPQTVRQPEYERSALRPGIVHFGLGAFHRAHQAVYTQRALEAAFGPWGIVAVNLRSAEPVEALHDQDGLYSVTVRNQDGDRSEVIGATVDWICAATERERVLDYLTRPEIRIVTMTVSEKAYGLDPATGGLDLSHPAVAADLKTPEAPCGVLGFLAQESLAVLLRDLIIVGVDFREGQEAMAVAAIIDESGLQRRLDARHLGKIDISFELLALGRLEVEFLNTVPLYDRHAGFFPVASVDKHAGCHQKLSERGGPSSDGGRSRDMQGAKRGPTRQAASSPEIPPKVKTGYVQPSQSHLRRDAPEGRLRSERRRRAGGLRNGANNDSYDRQPVTPPPKGSGKAGSARRSQRYARIGRRPDENC